MCSGPKYPFHCESCGEHETTIGMWIPHPRALRRGYEAHRRWPDFVDEVRDAYATYTLLEWLVCTRDLMNRPADVANLEACLIGTLV